MTTQTITHQATSLYKYWESIGVSKERIKDLMSRKGDYVENIMCERQFNVINEILSKPYYPML